MALRGPEYLPHSKNTQSTTRSSEPSTTPMTSEDQATESVPDKEKRTMRSLKKTRKDELLSTASSPSLRSLGQDRQPQRMPSYTPTPTTYNSKSKPFLALTTEDRERDRENLEKLEKLEREAQYSKKWDDHLGFSITLGGKDKSKTKDRYSSKALREDRNNTFIPTSREEAEQAGMKVICIKFRVQSATAGEGDKLTGQDSAFSKTRKYTSTGPSLALVAGGMKLKMKSSTGPHVVIDSGVYIGEPPLEDFGSIPGGSSRPTITTTDSVTTSPVSHPTGFAWNLFGGIKVDDKERKTAERRKTANDHGSLPPLLAAAEDFETPTTVNSLGWKYVSPPRLEKGSGCRSTEFAGEVDEAGYAIIIPERSDSISPSLPKTARPTVVVPILTPALATTTTTPATSPKSQPEHETLNQANDNSHSDSSSSISVSSPVFAHSPNESDLDDESFGPASGGGAASATSGVSCRPRKGYRYGGYVQAQMKKAKKEGGDERLVIGDRRGIGKAAEVEVNSKLGDAGQPQQAKREGKERNRDKEREGWIALDMVNDNGSFKFSYIYIYSRILSAFNSILRILHRHSPPYLSSSFTHSHTIIDSPNTFTKAKLDLHHRSKDQRVPSDTDDDGQYAATAKSTGTSHPTILGSLAARAAPAQQLAYVALPYPEWRLNLVNHARRAGMREIGRPLDLALHGWGRDFEEAAARERKMQREMEREKQNRRKSEQSHVSTIKARGKRVDKVAGGSDADDDNDGDEDGDEQEAMGATQLDSDSEEESDTEWLAWMTDLPRQFLVQQSQMTVPTSPTSQSSFANPFSSSPLVEGDDEPIRPPRTQEEERTLHADRIRYLEPSSTVRANPTYLPSPTSISFLNSLKQLSSRSSYESLSHHQQGSSSRNSTPFPGLSSTDDLLVNKGNHSRSQSRSLQHLGSYRYGVGSVPEESGDGYNLTALSSSQNHGLHHSVSVDQHLSSRRKEVDSHRRYDSITSDENQFALGKPILTNEQILQIESEVFTSATNTSLPLHWTLPPIPVPSPSPPPPSTSASKVRLPAAVSINASGEVKVSSSISAINRITPDLTRWSTSFGNSLSTPSSPSAPTNSTSPPRTSVLGSLGRSPSLLGKISGQEREKKGFLKKRMSRDLAKDKEKEKDRDTGERAISPTGASPRQRPKLLLPGLSSSTSSYSPTSLPNHPEIPFSIHNSNLSSGYQLHQSVNAISSSARTLRHVHSGTSLRGEEGFTNTAAGLEVISPPETEGKEVQKKRKGPIDMIVRGFDSSLAFAEGR